MEKQINISLHKKPKVWTRQRNQIRSLHLKHAKKQSTLNKMKESLWNDRFYIDKMDDYDRKPKKFSFREKLQTLQVKTKPLLSNPIKDNALFKTLRVDNNHSNQASKQQPRQKKQLTINQLTVDHDIPVFQLKMALKKIWEENNIPLFHRNIFLEGLEKNSLKRARKYIIKEINNIRSQKSLIIMTKKAIMARENCIAKLNSLITTQKKIVKFEQLDEKVQGLIKDYQELSTLTIQNIVNWRTPLQKLFNADKSNYYHISFDFDGENYMKRIIHDSVSITQWLGLPKQDFFLIGLKLKKSSVVRIRASELMVLQEALVQDINGKTMVKLK